MVRSASSSVEPTPKRRKKKHSSTPKAKRRLITENGSPLTTPTTLKANASPLRTPLVLPRLSSLRVESCRVFSPALANNAKKVPVSMTIDNDRIQTPGLLMYDSEAEAQAYCQWMIAPMNVETFFKCIWEQNILHVKRNQPDYYEGIFSTEELFALMLEQHLEYTTNINLARYKSGQRETLNPSGRAFAPVVRAYFEAHGCSVQFINPQAYSDRVWTLCDRLQELFGCFVGANTYLTPAGSQGFAPHWDEIDAFILQLEGRKRWKVYEPFDEESKLPRESSGNFTEADIAEHKKVLDEYLEAGDLLFMPRGFIHQGSTDDDAHSLHITISVCRKNAYADMLEKFVPEALQACIHEKTAFRKALPKSILSNAGVSVDAKEPETRERYRQAFRDCMAHLAEVAERELDSAVDMQAAEIMRTMLPPVLTDAEKACSVYGIDSMPTLTPNTAIKFIRKHGQRLIYDPEENARLEHRMHNSRVFEERQCLPIEISSQHVDKVEMLINCYPHYVLIGNLPGKSFDEKLELATLLFQNGLVMFEAGSAE